MGQDARKLIAETAKFYLDDPTCTKRTAVRMALSETVRKGLIRPGETLPLERELVDLCGVSLGTVHAALSQLK